MAKQRKDFCMAWTTPITWATNQLVAASDMNNNVRDNANYLFNGRPQTTKKTAFSTLSTSSTTFVDVDATNLIITHIAGSGRVLLLWTVPVLTPAVGTANASLDIIMDSTTRIGDATYGLTIVPPQFRTSCTVIGLVTGVSVGSHTFKLQVRAHAGTIVVGENTIAGSLPWADIIAVDY
jgi:hypothetical protein